jgi:enterochelin esterase-like enzyme
MKDGIYSRVLCREKNTVVQIKESSVNRLFIFVLLCFKSVMALANSDVSFGVERSITSNILQENRTYFVYLPPSYGSSKAQYPVVYLLDGDVHRWKAVAGLLEGLSTATLEQQVAEAIVVAIPGSENAIRERDLTPTNIAKWTFKGKVLEEFNNNTGNAAHYLSFFKEELIPEINKTYRTSGQRVIVGARCKIPDTEILKNLA